MAMLYMTPGANRCIAVDGYEGARSRKLIEVLRLVPGVPSLFRFYVRIHGLSPDISLRRYSLMKLFLK